MRAPKFLEKRVSHASVLALVLLTGASCKDTTETVVETAVKTAKDTAKGIGEGIEKGRKSGASADDASIVTKNEDLVGKGSIQVLGVRASEGDDTHSEVDLAIENITDAPLRLSQLEIIALDSDGFAHRPDSVPGSVTVPRKAKEKITVRFPVGSDAIAKVRIWSEELPVK